MSTTPNTCQIVEYVDAANGGTHKACSNPASHSVGLIIGTLIFDFRLCPDCHNWVIKAAKVQEACMQKMYQSSGTDNDTYEKLLNKIRVKLGHD